MRRKINAFLMLQNNSITKNIMEALGEEYNLAKEQMASNAKMAHSMVAKMVAFAKQESFELSALTIKLKDIEKEIRASNDYNSCMVEEVIKARNLLKQPTPEKSI